MGRTSSDLVDRLSRHPVTQRQHRAGLRTGTDRSGTISIDLALVCDAHADHGVKWSLFAFVLAVHLVRDHMRQLNAGVIAARHVDTGTPGVDSLTSMLTEQPVTHSLEAAPLDAKYRVAVEVERTKPLDTPVNVPATSLVNLEPPV